MSTRFHLADLPPHLREQAAAQIDGAVPISPVTAARSAKGSSDDHLGRLRAGEMNLTETAYARDLELQRLRGEIIAWKFGCLSLKLADRTHYRPDFLVTLLDRTLRIDEVKGRWRDDARAKWKIAAELFRDQYLFLAIRKRLKRDGGGWDIETYRR
jgi:hypothetical protein